MNDAACLPNPPACLSVRPERLCRIAKPSQHEPDRCQTDERHGVARQVLEILGQTTAPVQPSQCPFNHPASRKHLEAARLIRARHDLDGKLWQGFRHGPSELGPLIGPVGKQLAQKRKQAEQGRQNPHAAVAVLKVRRMNHDMQQKT